MKWLHKEPAQQQLCSRFSFSRITRVHRSLVSNSFHRLGKYFESANELYEYALHGLLFVIPSQSFHVNKFRCETRPDTNISDMWSFGRWPCKPSDTLFTSTAHGIIWTFILLVVSNGINGLSHIFLQLVCCSSLSRIRWLIFVDIQSRLLTHNMDLSMAFRRKLVLSSIYC